MADFALSRIGVSTVMDTDAVLANGARKAADFDNDTDKANFCDVLLTVKFTVAPSVGDIIGELYLLYGDGEGTESFPDGGDSTTGTDDTPQQALLVGTFETVNPSTSTDETLLIKDVPLRVGATNRLVFENVSGQQMATTWQLDIVKYKWTN